MKKKSLKGEISTIITLGTLIVLGFSSLVSTVFLKKTQTIKTKAAGCSQVSSVSYSGNVAAGQTFTCLASTDGASRYTMACGISKNGGWPYGMRSGSCSGTRCTFSVKMDDQIEAGAVYELVAFDFRSDCGPNTGKKITLNVSGAQPQPTQANCDQECCGKPDGFIYQQAIKETCDSNYKGGRYVIINGVCQGGKKTEKPGCATCKTCQAGAPDISPVPGADLAVNECTSSCEQSGGGICSNLPNCPANITPAIVRSCSDASFSCTLGYTACKKDGAIWCYGSGSIIRERTSTPTTIPTSISRGGEGQPCIGVYDSASKSYQYYCNENLVCTKQSTDGICVTPTSTPTTTPTNTAILTPTSQPICYPYGPNLPNCVTPTPTPRLLTETGVLANPGVLIIENVTNNKTLRLKVVSLVGSNYEHLFVDILPRQSYTYNYSRFCTWLRRNLSGHIAYSSSEDNFISVKWKKIDLSCDRYLLIGIE